MQWTGSSQKKCKWPINMAICSLSFTLRKMKIKTTLCFSIITIRGAIIKKTSNKYNFKDQYFQNKQKSVAKKGLEKEKINGKTINAGKAMEDGRNSFTLLVEINELYHYANKQRSLEE